MDTNKPIDRQDVDQVDYDLHTIAGLTCVGTNEDGELEYLGTQKQWNEYRKLSQEHTDSCAGCALCEE